MPDVVDITDWEEQYDDLTARISRYIKVNYPGMSTLPEQITMTKRQHKMLRRYPEMSTMFATDQKLWQTHFNVMEVTIID